MSGMSYKKALEAHGTTVCMNESSNLNPVSNIWQCIFPTEYATQKQN